MSTELFMRGLFALLMGGCFCWAVHRNKNVEDTFDPERKHQRYLPLVSGVILPVFVLGTAAVMLIVRPAGVEQSILSMFFSLFLHISVYYLILLALLPFCAGTSAPPPARLCGSSRIISTSPSRASWNCPPRR